jgi:clan AA aspartic protease
MQVVDRLREIEMGRVLVSAKLSNVFDQERAQAGELDPREVRSMEVEGLVDTGATLMVLPQYIIEGLGVPLVREVTVTYANGRKAQRGVARGIVVEILGRDAVVDAIVEPDATTVLIGQVPLEVMDLVIDPKRASLGPRPESPDSPLIELY